VTILQALLAVLGVLLLFVSAFRQRPAEPSWWQLGWAFVVLAVLLPLIKAGLAGL